jgi:thioredoxin reductase
VETESQNNYLVAVIGAGPAGLYAAKQLASQGVYVVLVNRDIKPGGLAEYGIYHSKHKMKEGLRKQFRRILDVPNIEYFGNLVVGQKGDFTLKELDAMGIQAVLVTVGAQGTKWLGLPGEDLLGVYHAKDIVYHYNKLPPFSQKNFAIGKHVAIIGVGNVMLDIARWLIRDMKVEQVTAVARRGPAEVKFTKKEMQSVARNLDLTALDDEIERVSSRMHAVGQDPAAAKDFILSALDKAQEPVSDSRFTFDFLASPSAVSGVRCAAWRLKILPWCRKMEIPKPNAWAPGGLCRWIRLSSASVTGWMRSSACLCGGMNTSKAPHPFIPFRKIPTRLTIRRRNNQLRGYLWPAGLVKPVVGWSGWRAKMESTALKQCCSTWKPNPLKRMSAWSWKNSASEYQN